MPKVNLSAVTITELVDHLEGQKRRIDEQLLELRGVLGESVGNGNTCCRSTANIHGGGQASDEPAGRQRIATAQKAAGPRQSCYDHSQATAPAPVPCASRSAL